MTAESASNTLTPTPRPIRKILVGLLVVIVIGLAYGLSPDPENLWNQARQNIDQWQAWVDQNTLIAIVICFGVYLLITALSLPFAGVASIVCGALFGRWLGTGIVSLASTIGATLAFLMSRYLFRATTDARFGTKIHRFNQGLARDGAFYLFSLRLVPIFPFFLINLGMGLTPIRTSKFVLASWLGMLPGTFLYANAGTSIRTIHQPSDIFSWQIIVAFAMLALAPWILKAIIGRLRKNDFRNETSQ